MFWPFRSCWDENENMIIINYNYLKQKHINNFFLSFVHPSL
ncbi:hypothetical protein MtrunA17_Chr3g0124591 [Medicago truncatula]|uniref:Uncharacterized protein n=1 Tax=Medicago truncatula TaxID=3880 RepID=A0A396IYD8_MEDTR|nr:hypothetical protein MtrunA17_Chr3g0124591 [Medicago truncatula]